MKTFDFKHEDFRKSCEAKQGFLILNHNKPITSQEFVNHIQNMPKHPNWSKGHGASSARRQYKRLKENYGFFGEEYKVK